MAPETSGSENSGSAPLDAVRNIGILAHIDAGKTSLTERLLHVAGLRPVAGGVDEGTTATDYLDIERERGITVKAASVNLGWKGCFIHLIDTPGHVDFGAEVDRSIRALDGAVLAVCGVAGVQSRTEVLIAACAKSGLPRLVFVNKMDRRGADFLSVLDDLRSGVEPGVVAVQMPWGEGESFKGIIDLIRMDARRFSEDLPPLPSGRERGDAPAELPCAIPEDLLPRAEKLRSFLVEKLADHDLSIMEDFLTGATVSPERILVALRRATLSLSLVPALCGTAFRDLPAMLLLDAVRDFLPSPFEAATPEGVEPKTGSKVRRRPDRHESFSALVFKTSSDPQNGRLCWTRVWSGSLQAGGRILDSQSKVIVRTKKIFSIQADKLEETPEAAAGDIVALSLSGAPSVGGSGATLCDPAHPLLYESMRVPEPVVSVVIEPRTASDTAKIGSALEALVAEDSALRVFEDPQTGRYELSGLGELHLEVAIERLSREYGARIRTGNPRVAYRETLTVAVSHREEFDRDIGGERMRTAVEAELAPGPRGSGMLIEAAPGLRIPAVWIEAARKGLSSALSAGPVSGHPLDDIRATIRDVQVPTGSGRLAEVAVEAAASLCGRYCTSHAKGILLEPVMRVEVEVPEAFFGATAAAITSRGGRLESVDDVQGGKSIAAAAPMRVLFGFATELRSATEGRAVFQARFFRFEPAPPSISGT